MLKPRVVVSPDSTGWPEMAAETLAPEIERAISSRGVCHLMLTGGKTAERLYRYWADSSALPLDRIEFWFGDERCVPPDHADSNFALAVKTLFGGQIPAGCRMTRMEAERSDREQAARDYGQRLPETIDILLLGMGPDGHIASLFPHSPLLQSSSGPVLPVTGPKPPFDRLTITPQVIQKARSVFLLAMGKEKGNVLAKALKTPDDSLMLPVRLAIEGSWLLDPDATQELQKNSTQEFI